MPKKPNSGDVIPPVWSTWGSTGGTTPSSLIASSNATTKSTVKVSTSTTSAVPISGWDRLVLQGKLDAAKTTAENTLKSSHELYAVAIDKAGDTKTLNDNLTANKVYLTEIEKAIQQNAKGFTIANSVTFVSEAAKTSALSQLTIQQKDLDAEHSRIQGFIDSLNDKIAAKVESKNTTLTHEVKTVKDVPTGFGKGIVAPPQLNPNTSPAGASLISAPDPKVEEQTQVSTTGRPSRGLALQYNVPTVADAYFSNNVDYLKETTYRGNTPQKIERAVQLFNSAANSKGMFAMTSPQKNLSGIAPGGGDPGGGAGWSYEAEWVKWGFQFLYNPATVSMTYAMAPAVDLGMLTSGREGFNLMGTDGNFSTISFEIIINRMFDMKYFNKNGTLTEAGKAQYGNHVPTGRDQADIFKKGTMYDIEYLLRTASQGALIQKSWLRGYTADLGYIGAAPIELHLGKSMRYWGMLSGLTVNHTIFNEKMIPIFSSVELTFSRYVEPPKAPK